MANKKFYTDIDLTQSSSIKNGGFEILATDPVSPVEGQEWCNSTDGKRKIFKGGVVREYIFQTDLTTAINSLGQLQGAYDANPGALPTIADKTQGDLTALVAGDSWVISNAGTLTGIQGDDVLSPGDKIQYLGGTPTDANNWVGIQTNLDESKVGNVAADRQTVNLVAATGLTVSSSSIADIHSVQVYDATGALVEVCIEKNANSNERVITSNANLTGVTVELTGTV